MAVTKHIVTVTLTVEVTVDEDKFTPEFYEEFTTGIAPWDTISQHVEHLAWVHATGLQDLSTFHGQREFAFVEGYGPVNEMGISARLKDTEVEYEGLTHG